MGWKLSANQGRCDTCGREFDDGETYVSSIVETEEGFQRGDFCISCWEASGKDGSF